MIRSRRAGRHFRAAWRLALCELSRDERTEWGGALAATKANWRAAYLQRPDQARVLAGLDAESEATAPRVTLIA